MKHLRGIFSALFASSALPADEVALSFNRDIRPILSDNCFGCHGTDAHDAKAGLQLHSFEAATAPLGKGKDRQALVPGDRGASELWKRVRSKNPEEIMPPPDSNHRLSPEQIELLGRWIDQGAGYEGHWSFQTVAAPKGASIDSLIRAQFEESGLRPASPANRETLLRRLTQDLTGLPPTPEEIDVFLADQKPGAYERVVDRLLASPATAERLAVDWLDGARYADTNGYSIDDHRDMWIWRDWVLHAFLTNKRFDEFAVEQIAGDLLPQATEQQRVATGFLRNSMNTHEGGTIPEEYRVTYNVDKVDTVATVFMGLTMKCAQCHDHKYDPISQKEFYQFYAFFNQSSEPGSGGTNSNTAPLIEAGSAICDADRVKRDVRQRIAELDRLRVTPEPAMARIRDEWESRTLPTLAPPPKEATKPADLPRVPHSSASWIWAADDKQAAKTQFEHRFQLEGEPTAAQLLFTCDDACTVKINGGKAIEKKSLWMEPKIVRITNLKAGENHLEVSATNDGPSPAGLLFSLAVRADDGTVKHFVSSSAWSAKVVGAKWKPAVDLGQYGAQPWGKKLSEEAPSGAGNSALYAALSKPKPKRSKAGWKTINDAFAAVSGPFKIYIHQLNLEEKVLSKTAQSGRATVMVMDYKPRDTHILDRGAYDQPGEKVTADGPAILPLLNGPDGKAKTRLELARWLVDPAHPLTSRVIVNRYWQMIFGTGLVKTAEDFGAQGEYPSHPELLDWLAADFVEHGWDLRRVLKQIVMSETYAQSSAATPDSLELDPYNRLLARAPRFRLGAEFVRDSALLAAGLINRDLGGPSVHPYQPDGLWAEISHYGYPAGFTSQKFLPGSGRALYRRSMYTAWKRTSPPAEYGNI
ncbi:PSD1 and planctomycete cytochrome C domain-containing protein [Akkermansiaceae bacterium]|nr:PSD1 and planctomycete cytochrome C domain-containing protein [Akkermansiaceae bacterium]